MASFALPFPRAQMYRKKLLGSNTQLSTKVQAKELSRNVNPAGISDPSTPDGQYAFEL
jgi:hypothetical protein